MNLQQPSAASPPRLWPLCLWIIPLLALLAWAGSAADPRSALPWLWTKTHWLALAPGLTALWTASALLFISLSVLAFHLLTSAPSSSLPGSRRFSLWPALFILLIAASIRILIAFTWFPLPLDAAALALKNIPPPPSWANLTLIVDLLTITVLLIALRTANRSPWFAALYAFHPLPLIEIAAHAHWICFLLLPLLPLVIIFNLPNRRLTAGISLIASLAAVVGAAFTATQAPFNSLAAAFVPALDISDNPSTRIAFFTLIQIILQVALLAIAHARQWSLGRTLLHIATLFLLASPAIYPWEVLALLVLLPLFWSRAAWVMSIGVLAAYAAIPAPRVQQHLAVPLWLVLFEGIPIAILEFEELLASIPSRPVNTPSMIQDSPISPRPSPS